jgi:hypothetical protein
MIKKTMMIVALAVLLQNCASVGNKSMKGQNEGTVSQVMVRGETTIQEVTRHFGVPMSTSFTESGNKIYTYLYDDTSAFTPETVGSVLFTWGLAGSKARGTRTELAILFDGNDRVKNYTVHSSKVEAGTMLFK